MTFQAIQEEIRNILDVPPEDITPEMTALFDEYINELADQEANKVDNLGQFLRLETASAAAIEAEGKRLLARAKSRKNSIAYLKMRYLQTMESAGLKKVKGQVYTMSIHATDVVQITDEQALPQEYVTQRVVTAPDKTALKDALKNGAVVPGAQLAKSYSLRVA
jgi:hypothetical protein